MHCLMDVYPPKGTCRDGVHVRGAAGYHIVDYPFAFRYFYASIIT